MQLISSLADRQESTESFADHAIQLLTERPDTEAYHSTTTTEDGRTPETPPSSVVIKKTPVTAAKMNNSNRMFPEENLKPTSRRIGEISGLLALGEGSDHEPSVKWKLSSFVWEPWGDPLYGVVDWNDR